MFLIWLILERSATNEKHEEMIFLSFCSCPSLLNSGLLYADLLYPTEVKGDDVAGTTGVGATSRLGMSLQTQVR